MSDQELRYFSIEGIQGEKAEHRSKHRNGVTGSGNNTLYKLNDVYFFLDIITTKNKTT